ncbi:COMM domain-containing protein 9-like [Biomphalaria glabrata]|uniref:COMM domain-containing protein 9-like n=1 Tax=Biomphalaria glabrata TaxID=6526 RepID=A0A9W3BIX5_BIOGL|nr:COMM domain-containing protein 9-like [Biomphalaria glabrata]KAI8761069.1 COMM domain-containing protein 9 [Biomphalaria glabrata]
MKFNYSTLEILVKLSSKQQMLDLCEQAFLYRKRSPAHLPDSLVQSLSQTLSISINDSRSCISTLSNLLKTAVFQGSTDPQVIVALFPNGFHKNLRDLLMKIIIENMAKWKASAIANQVSLPKLLDFDWRVDMKTSSDSVARMSVPTCMLNLEIQEQPGKIQQTAGIENVSVELSKETLDTMLDGLGKIRDQLASVANR